MSGYYLELNNSSDQRVLWPDRCAFCGAKAEARAEAGLSRVSGASYYGVAFGLSTQSKSFLYPVCLRHKRLFTFLSEPAKWSFFYTLVFLFTIPGGFFFGLLGLFILLEEFAGIALGVFSVYLPLCVFFLLFIFMVIWKILAIVYVPIKLIYFEEKTVTLFFRNNSFLQNFMMLNKDMIKNS